MKAKVDRRRRLPPGHPRRAAAVAGRASATCGRSRSAICPRSKKSSPTTISQSRRSMPLNVTISGVVQAEDVDHFVVELKKGAAADGRAGRAAAGQHVLRSVRGDPERGPLRAGPQRRRGPAQPGLPVLRSSPRKTASTSCRSARARSAATARALYRLHVGGFPRPTAVYPAGGKPGETLNVKWIGDAARRVHAAK